MMKKSMYGIGMPVPYMGMPVPYMKLMEILYALMREPLIRLFFILDLKGYAKCFLHGLLRVKGSYDILTEFNETGF